MKRNDLQATTIRYARNYLRNSTERMEAAVKMLAAMERHYALFPDLSAFKGINFWSSDGWNNISVYVKVPWDTVLCDQVCLAFIKLGWELKEDKDYVANYKERTFRFRHPILVEKDIDIGVVIDMNAGLEGSKCQLVVDHVETREVNVYRVVCEDEVNV